MVGAQLDDGKIIGQLPGTADQKEQLGLLLAKDSPLTACVSKAVDALRADGSLDEFADDLAGREGHRSGSELTLQMTEVPPASWPGPDDPTVPRQSAPIGMPRPGPDPVAAMAAIDDWTPSAVEVADVPTGAAGASGRR